MERNQEICLPSVQLLELALQMLFERLPNVIRPEMKSNQLFLYIQWTRHTRNCFESLKSILLAEHDTTLVLLTSHLFEGLCRGMIQLHVSFTFQGDRSILKLV